MFVNVLSHRRWNACEALVCANAMLCNNWDKQCYLPPLFSQQQQKFTEHSELNHVLYYSHACSVKTLSVWKYPGVFQHRNSFSFEYSYHVMDILKHIFSANDTRGQGLRKWLQKAILKKNKFRRFIVAPAFRSQVIPFNQVFVRKYAKTYYIECVTNLYLR